MVSVKAFYLPNFFEHIQLMWLFIWADLGGSYLFLVAVLSKSIDLFSVIFLFLKASKQAASTAYYCCLLNNLLHVDYTTFKLLASYNNQ